MTLSWHPHAHLWMKVFFHLKQLKILEVTVPLSMHTSIQGYKKNKTKQNQGNLTLSKEYSDFPVTDYKDIEIYELIKN